MRADGLAMRRRTGQRRTETGGACAVGPVPLRIGPLDELLDRFWTGQPPQGGPSPNAVQQRAAKTTAAYRRERTEGRKEGEAEGYQRGRLEGERLGGNAGFYAGLLTSNFAAKHGRAYDTDALGTRLLQRNGLEALAASLIPADYRRDWNALVRRLAGRHW